MGMIPREIDSFWTLFTAPVVWALHFLTCYISVAVFCAKPGILGLDFGSVRAVIAAVTLGALATIVLSALLAWRQWGFGTQDPPHNGPTHQDRMRFQGFATTLLSGLSFVAVIMTALPAFFVAGCLR
jgi:hypothetical protein